MAKVTAPNNMDIWNALGKTDPAATKQFTRAGGFKGTAVKPMWANMRMTEFFGPCGNGWGTGKPEYQLVEADGEILVFCTLAMWYTQQGVPYTVYGVGGDKVVARGKEGFRTDDEAFKKAYTDALSNAMKFIGVAADVHMGQFDDNKYVRQVAAEFDEAKRAEVNAEIDRQKAASNIGPASGKGDAGIEPLPPELEWHYQRNTGILICRILDVQKKTKKAGGAEYLVLQINNKLDETNPGKPLLFYWHATHRDLLLASKGKIAKFQITEKIDTKGPIFTIEAIREIGGEKVGPEPVANSTKPLSDDETQARLLASTLDLQEEELRELHALNKHNWTSVLSVLKTEQERRAEEEVAQ